MTKSEHSSAMTVAPKVISVHEHGTPIVNWISRNGKKVIACGKHFIKFPENRKLDIVVTSIKSFESFELPVYSFSTHTSSKWLFFSDEKTTFSKSETARGSRITFLDGTEIHVREMPFDIKSMIEGD